jgi:hypothetical protein
MFPFAYRSGRERYRTSIGAVGASRITGSRAIRARSLTPAVPSRKQFDGGSRQ